MIAEQTLRDYPEFVEVLTGLTPDENECPDGAVASRQVQRTGDVELCINSRVPALASHVARGAPLAGSFHNRDVSKGCIEDPRFAL